MFSLVLGVADFVVVVVVVLVWFRDLFCFVFVCSMRVCVWGGGRGDVNVTFVCLFVCFLLFFVFVFVFCLFVCLFVCGFFCLFVCLFVFCFLSSLYLSFFLHFYLSFLFSVLFFLVSILPSSAFSLSFPSFTSPRLHLPLLLFLPLTASLAQWLRRPPRERQIWVRFPLSPWFLSLVESYQ